MDREKVIKGLECCQQGFDCAEDCPYLMDCNDLMKPMFIELAKDALALLKEQPEIVRCKDCKECYFASNRIQSEQTFACGKHGIDVTPDWFCADGGKVVKWE